MPASMYEPENIEVGKRIESDGYYGTVRFVGNLQNHGTAKIQQDSTWVGVEWDEPSRGKHDGSFGGIRYFTTQHPSGGSFLRPQKCNTGVSFSKALVNRYRGPSAGNKLSEISLSAQNHIPEMESLGTDGVHEIRGYLSKVSTGSVHGMFVSASGMDDDLASCVAGFTNLDLSTNLLTEWSEIALIINQMPQLKVLNVSENRLRVPFQGISVLCDVKVLYMNRLEYDWSSVSCSAQLFAHLRELHVCYNRIATIENVLVSPFTEMTLIKIEGNPIASWNALLPLGDLPQLQTLIANECRLTSVRFPGSVTPSDCFPSLESLSISDNEIADWQSINELNRLRSLSSLRFASNPLSDGAKAADARHTAVAKIAHLQWCNGAFILPTERHGAEIDYLRLYSSEWKRAGGTGNLNEPLDAAFTVEHPRYVEMARKYGPVEEVQEKKSSALKNNLVTVQIRSTSSNETLTKQLPVKMTVQKLKVLVKRIFKIADISSIHLVHTVLKESSDDKSDSSPLRSVNAEVCACIEMDNDLRELSFYSLEDNAIIDVKW